ncbi:TVP38/TMEM64 family protein [Spiribacter onubensis]|uniref:TVP38/TMEM64 family membrane protein n=1 Tax=Spiribacter onubensis TaxID=3122420 RepID=A0ABV3S9U0_9GAMM
MPTRAEWREAIRRRWPLLWRSMIIVAIAGGVVALWQVYNLEAYTEIGRLLELGARLRAQPWAVPVIILLYIAAGVAFLPLTVMVVATILVYGPVGGFLLANAGTIATALSSFLLGRLLGAEPLRRLGGPTLRRLNAQAGRHGTMIVTALRVMPVAHFHAVSLLSGASAIGFWPYLNGTLIGTVPGIAIIAAVGNQTKRLLLDPDLAGLMVLTGLGAFSLIVLYAMRRWMRRYASGTDNDAEQQ